MTRLTTLRTMLLSSTALTFGTIVAPTAVNHSDQHHVLGVRPR